MPASKNLHNSGQSQKFSFFTRSGQVDSLTVYPLGGVKRPS
jgi:hypothetical protein